MEGVRVRGLGLRDRRRASVAGGDMVRISPPRRDHREISSVSPKKVGRSGG